LAKTLREQNVTVPCIIVTHLDWVQGDEKRFTTYLANTFHPTSPKDKPDARPQPEFYAEVDPAVISQQVDPGDMSSTHGDVAIRPDCDFNPSVRPTHPTSRNAPILFCDVPMGAGLSNLLHRLSVTGEKPPFDTLWTEPTSMDYDVGE
jgi:hypothetical protein